jgi:hypothetical protein
VNWRPGPLHFDIKVTAARFDGAPAARVHWCLRGHLDDLLSVQRDSSRNDPVAIDPETDLASWSFVVHATTEEQWRNITGRLWHLVTMMGAQIK